MSGEQEGGQWVRGDLLHPMTNMAMRKWRVAHPDGSVTTGTYRMEADYPAARRSHLEWFFPEAAE